jgi:hypothetical protein
VLVGNHKDKPLASLSDDELRAALSAANHARATRKTPGGKVLTDKQVARLEDSVLDMEEALEKRERTALLEQHASEPGSVG